MWSIICLVYRFTKPWLRKNLYTYSEEKKVLKKLEKFLRKPEAATGDVLELFFRISQSSLVNTCVRASI